MNEATCSHSSSTSPAARYVNDALAEARGYRLSLVLAHQHLAPRREAW
ncbi:MAG TPA: hypothetical protein VGJ59_14600 [Jatrophihabitantaceae bacterium]